MRHLFLVVLSPGQDRLFAGFREAEACAFRHMELGDPELMEMHGDEGPLTLWGDKRGARYHRFAEVTPIAPPLWPRWAWGPWLYVSWRGVEPRLFAWRWRAKLHDNEGSPFRLTLPLDEPPVPVDLYGVYLWFHRVLLSALRPAMVRRANRRHSAW